MSASKQSEAKKKWWSKVTPLDRSTIMSKRIKKYWDAQSDKTKLLKGKMLKQSRLKS